MIPYALSAPSAVARAARRASNTGAGRSRTMNGSVCTQSAWFAQDHILVLECQKWCQKWEVQVVLRPGKCGTLFDSAGQGTGWRGSSAAGQCTRAHAIAHNRDEWDEWGASKRAPGWEHAKRRCVARDEPSPLPPAKCTRCMQLPVFLACRPLPKEPSSCLTVWQCANRMRVGWSPQSVRPQPARDPHTSDMVCM